MAIVHSLGCVPAGKGPSPASSLPITQRAQSVVVNGGWKPEDVELRCASEACPPQVGVVLIEEGRRAGSTTTIVRCTGTLIQPSSDAVITTGHCDREPMTGYFVVGTGAERQVLRLGRRLFKRFKPSLDPGLENPSPSAVVYQLESPAQGIRGLNLARGPQLSFDHLKAFVVNQDGVGLKYRVDEITCAVRRHEAYFPYDLQETPDLIRAFDCPVEKGHSGAAMFARGETEIQAVFQGFTLASDLAEHIRGKLEREPVALEAHTLVLATNVRCLDWPDKSRHTCYQVDEKGAARKWMATQVHARNLVSTADVADNGLRYSSLAMGMKFNREPYDRDFHVLRIPKCRMSASLPTHLTFPENWIRLTYDEWGQPQITTVDRRLSEAAVKVAYPGQVMLQVEAQWSQPFAKPLLDPNQHPRRSWGTLFNIALPQCAR